MTLAEQSYAAFGLAIRSELPLPELAHTARREDVVVRRARLRRPPQDAVARGRCFHATGDDVRLSWDDVGSFLVRRGREILVEAGPGVPEWAVRLFLLGPALAVLLEQRQVRALHASAVEIAGRAVAFLGDPGRGKSTLASALYARGHSLVADDLAAVSVVGGTAHVAPGAAWLKLDPATAAELGAAPADLADLGPDAGKCLRRADRNFRGAALPLARIYVLADGETEATEELAAATAAIELVRHSWCARLRHACAPQSQLEDAVRLAALVPVRRLRVPRSLARLDRVAALVEEEAA